MIAYPSEKHKGRAIGLFWVIFNLGGSVGGFMSFGLNFHSKSGTVSDSTCMLTTPFSVVSVLIVFHVDIAFIVVMAFGWFLGALIVPPTKVIRPDGSRPQAREKTSLGFSASMRYLYRILNWRIIILIPML